MGNNKGLSSNDLFGQKLLQVGQMEWGTRMATLTQQGREGYKLENVDSGNRLLPSFHPMDGRLALGTAGGRRRGS